MIAYVDTSVLIRVLFHHDGQLEDWGSLESVLSSSLLRTECLRTIDRLKLRAGLTEHDVARLRFDAMELFDRIAFAEVSGAVLDRAGNPFPTSLGTLDAIHLATAVEMRQEEPSLVMATHNQELATAAQAMGFPVIG